MIFMNFCHSGGLSLSPFMGIENIDRSYPINIIECGKIPIKNIKKYKKIKKIGGKNEK
jgi:hypothetical protein